MRLLWWVGITGFLVPGFMLAQNTGKVTAGPAELAPQQTLLEGQQSVPTSAVVSQFATGTDENEGDGKVAAAVEKKQPVRTGAGEEKPRPDVVTGNASSVVEKLNKAVLEVMRRADELGYKGRFRLLSPVIREVYDFRSISRHVLADYWKQLDKEQKQQFILKMTEYGISEYAGQFDGYEGEKFVILSEEPFRKRYRVVKARLEVPKGDDVAFVYILRQTKEGWKIVDVRYDGVSDLALKRGQFAEILEKGGFERLIAKLDEKIADYARGKKRKKKS